MAVCKTTTDLVTKLATEKVAVFSLPVSTVRSFPGECCCVISHWNWGPALVVLYSNCKLTDDGACYICDSLLFFHSSRLDGPSLNT